MNGAAASASRAFPPTRAAALARIAAVQPDDYARTRNALDGAVTQLSPYITHGLVSLPEVLAGVASRHPLGLAHRFVFELGWREFFRHVWQHRGDAILESVHAGPLPELAYTRELPADIRQGRTGVPVVDLAVHTLYATGMLHNHARLWLASYVVHMRKVHWRTGADWLIGHLLDGDLASNHLSWQWVAGTGSSKPYLFNADNVARYAPAAWHSPGSVIDQPYDALEAIARSARPVPVLAAGHGVEEPRLHPSPCMLSWAAPQAADVAGRDVWLVHPWALGDPPPDLPANALCLGLLLTDVHDAWPWSEARWAFVGERLAELAPRCWRGSRQDVAGALAVARSVQTVADPHVQQLLPGQVVQRTAPLFGAVAQPCPSFSRWWAQATRGLARVDELPGLTAWASPLPDALHARSEPASSHHPIDTSTA